MSRENELKGREGEIIQKIKFAQLTSARTQNGIFTVDGVGVISTGLILPSVSAIPLVAAPEPANAPTAQHSHSNTRTLRV